MPPLILTFRFRRSRSALCLQALELAQQGPLLELERETGLHYEVRFPLTAEPEALDRLVRLAQLLAKMKGTEFLVNGEVRRSGYRVLTCYRDSLKAVDLRAHCWVAVNQVQRFPKIKVGPREVLRQPSIVEKTYFPCRLAARIWANFDLTHPASLRAQAEATLVREGCDWCPQLTLDEWEARYGYPDRGTE